MSGEAERMVQGSEGLFVDFWTADASTGAASLAGASSTVAVASLSLLQFGLLSVEHDVR